MTSENETTTQLKRALQTLKELRARLESLEHARREPVAVIGMACRFPAGANSPEAYWQVLQNRVDGIGPVPADRWDGEGLFDADADAPGKLATRWGGFLAQVDAFDAAFFGISPREATHMDPQQRLMLEVAWEALEDAGLDLAKLAGSRTGVFLGVHNHSIDYYLMQAQPLEELDIYSGTGTSHSVVSGRIAYLFDLHGPNLALDTACSSSLTAVHLAVQSLRSGESDLALAGGVNVMLTPHFTMVASRMRMMAADGRCKAFDARADGFVRSEGCGAVLLKRLADARRDGDPILAVIRGSAINQDGRSNGLTAPNGRAQQMVIRAALQNAGVDPALVGYIETHGTGTPLGDPIEVEALAEVYGAPGPQGLPCVLGSAKTNLGHLEGAAGIAGFIKTVLTLQHQTIPANLHFQTLNPHISLAGTRLQIAAEERPFPAVGGPRLAGLSAFGWSGTNVHLILEEYTPPGGGAGPGAAQTRPEQPGLLPISARSPEALKALAEAYRALLQQANAPLADLCFSAANRRSHHAERLAVVGHSAPALAQALEAFLRGESHPGLAAGLAAENGALGVVFAFPGQGGQWLGMGRQLLAQSAVFRQVLTACEAAFQPYVQWSLLEQLNAAPEHSRLDEIDVVQPCLFAIQVGLAAELQARGIWPNAVVGHSLGEVAAAHVAGALSLADAARVICTRSRLMRRVSGQGAMAVVGLALEPTRALLAPYAARLSVAVSNSPASTVISGDPQTLAEVLAGLKAQNIFCRPVNVDVAAHSPQMEALRPELVAALAEIQPRPTTIPLYSTVTGSLIDGSALDAAYWGRNLRQPVLFAAAIAQLIGAGYSAFIECGPHPVLLSAIGQANRPETTPLTLLSAMRRAEDETLTLQAAAAGLYSAGWNPDWSKLLPAAGRPMRLPTYPWQRKRYWVQVKPQAAPDPLSHGLYQVRWQPQAATAEAAEAPGPWLVFCETEAPGGIGPTLADSLSAAGARVVRITPGPEFSQTAPDHFCLNPRQPEHFRRLLQVAPAPQGVAYLWGVAAPAGAELNLHSLQQAQTEQLGGALHLAQALAGASWQGGRSPRLWLITQNAQAVDGSRPSGLAQASLWGFGRVLAFEHPELWGGLVDLDGPAPQDLLRDLLGPADQQIAYRQGRRHVAQLARLSAPPPENSAPRFSPQAAYLVTGGLGGLGLKLAGWLADHGAQHLALLGRSRGSAAAQQAVQQLRERGLQVLTLQGDIGRPEDAARVLQEIAGALPPLRGIFHAAGIVEDALLPGQTWPAFERVLAAKVAGAWNLHQLTRQLPLEHFVLFSSASALLGTPAQANYAAANAFLDALACERRAAGLPGLSINWGAWGQVGLAAQQERPQQLARLGIESFSPEKGLAALERVLAQPMPQVMAAALRWEKFLDQRPGGNACAFFAEMKPAAAPSAADPAAPDPLLSRLAAAAPAERFELLRAAVQQIVAKVLRFEGSQELACDVGFFKLGLDSLMAVDLKNSLQKVFGRSLRTTLAFDYPNINLLSHYLLGELYPAPAPTAAPAAAPAAEETFEDLSHAELKSLLEDEIRDLENDL